MEEQELTQKIIGCAMRVHTTLGPGFLESVYQRALTHELRKTGLQVDCEEPIAVRYDSVVSVPPSTYREKSGIGDAYKSELEAL